MEKADFFPLFIPVKDHIIVVVGGGRVASRRIKSLLKFSCRIIVIAPVIEEEIRKMSVDAALTLYCKCFEPADVRGAFLVLAATDDQEVNDFICKECKKQQILVNHAGDREQCDFYFPGIVAENDIVAGITALGKDHRKAKQVTCYIREKIKELNVKCCKDQED